MGGSHKDVYKIVGTGVLDGPRHINFGRELVFSADLCYTILHAQQNPDRFCRGVFLLFDKLEFINQFYI